MATKVDRVSISQPGQKLLWCPFAEIVKPEMVARGVYPRGYPEGAIVHFTAGHQDKTGQSAVAYGREQGHLYFYIDATGKIFQAFPLNKWGYHAGNSNWKGLGSGVSRRTVGIEVAAAGKVTKNPDGTYTTWFKKKIPASQVRASAARANISAGTYQKFTAAQEESLVSLLVWLKTNAPEIFNIDNIAGHDEVSPGRKTDPGAALSLSMPELREKIRSLVKA